EFWLQVTPEKGLFGEGHEKKLHQYERIGELVNCKRLPRIEPVAPYYSQVCREEHGGYEEAEKNPPRVPFEVARIGFKEERDSEHYERRYGHNVRPRQKEPHNKYGRYNQSVDDEGNCVSWYYAAFHIGQGVKIHNPLDRVNIAYTTRIY